MLGCWMDQAKERPTFPELVLHLGDLLQARAKQVMCQALTSSDLRRVAVFRCLVFYIASCERIFQELSVYINAYCLRDT